MKSLFPEMEDEIREDRTAAKREQKQRARDYLRTQDTSWLINRLLDHGPNSEANLLMVFLDERGLEHDPKVNVLGQLWNLSVIGKLWKKSLGIHPGAGVESFRFGVRGVHSQNKDSARLRDSHA